MTLGTGIFLSTVLVLIALGLRQISKHGKWRVTAKWAGATVSIFMLVGLALWAWVW